MYYTERLREIREEKELTQQIVANSIGIKREQYRRYENGINLLPITHLISLAKFYQVSSDYILGLTDDPTPPVSSEK